MSAKQSGKQNSAFNKFLKENKSLAFMVPLLVILVVVLIIVYSGGDDKPDGSATPTSPSVSTSTSQDTLPSSIENQTQVEVLPILERADDGQGDGVVPIQDPFTSPMKLTGILLYSDERTRAIIEYGGVTYIVGKDETIGDTIWVVTEIFENSVMLASDDKNLLLELNNEYTGS